MRRIWGEKEDDRERIKCGCVGDGGETENDTEGTNVDVAEMGVKEKTTEKGRMWMRRRWGETEDDRER